MDQPIRETRLIHLKPVKVEANETPPESEDDTSWKWRIAFWTVVSFTVLCYLFLGFFFSTTGPDLVSTIWFVSVVFLCCLLGAYTGFGRQPVRWLAVAMLTPLIGAYACYSLGGGSDLFEFEVFVIGIVAVMTLTTWVLRVCKGDLIRVMPGDQNIDALQFGIRDILIWTTATAVFVVIGQRIWSLNTNAYIANTSNMVPILGLSFSLSIATVINIWALFGKQITSWKVIVVIAMTFASAVASRFLFSGIWFFAAVAFGSQILAVAAMFCLRMQRYRFVKRQF